MPFHIVVILHHPVVILKIPAVHQVVSFPLVALRAPQATVRVAAHIVRYHIPYRLIPVSPRGSVSRLCSICLRCMK